MSPKSVSNVELICNELSQLVMADPAVTNHVEGEDHVKVVFDVGRIGITTVKNVFDVARELEKLSAVDRVEVGARYVEIYPADD